MLKKFLPNLKPKQENQTPNYDISPNLLVPAEVKIFRPLEAEQKIIIWIKYTFLVTPAVTLILVALYFAMLFINNKLEEQRNRLLTDLSQYQSVEGSYAIALRKISILKRAFYGTRPITEYASALLTQVPGTILVNELDIRGKTASLTISSSSALDFALLTQRYFSTTAIDQVVLKSADYNAGAQKFLVRMDVIFR